ncbi:MAG: aromatic ring-hydroxylating dioxygenase subunit alpha [Myxococcota bacterium]
MNPLPLQRGILLHNNWYVAAYSSEVVNKPLGRRICGRRIVLYRTAHGVAVALEDRCSHRGLPLSRGECEGDRIRCLYHGMEFDPTGDCVRVPGQSHIPNHAGIRSYPLVERDDLVWIWTGDPARADPERIPPWKYHSDPSWVHTKGFLAVKANWQLIADNLLSLNHLQYVHRSTIGSPARQADHAQVETQRVGDRVHMAHWVPHVDPPPLHQTVCGFKGKVDRWQECEFFPGFLLFWSGSVDAGTGAYEGQREGGFQIRHFHATTPESELTSHYFFTAARNFRLDDEEITETMHRSMLFTFNEDLVVLEAQQASLLEASDVRFVNRKDDAPGILARRLVDELLAREP